ncbi:endonuclease domain-containing protein [Dietzia lutea]|uniref:DUF559 domain-containing protein n=1 Tax=Dietzia lutea TaxID=546160 RepID=A0A2S1R4M9_9ACTN|nr:DUF559 domain-containing protein [Dietzia lutea]AWH91202.1 hypothetical protein A6035_02370 [Dietzia lutea]
MSAEPRNTPIRTRDLRPLTGSRVTNRGYARLHHGLWVRDTVRVDAWTRAEALMTLYPDATLTGWLAATLYGHDFPPRVFADDVVAPGRRIERPGLAGWQYRIPPEHIHVLTSGHSPDIRIASPEWVLFDIARREPRVEAICALDTSTTMGVLPISRLPALVEGARGVRGRRTVLDRLAEVDTEAESPWETRTRLFLLENGLTGFALQHWVPQFRYRLDIAWPELKVAVEYDGEDHRTKEQQARDEIRRNRLRAAGWYIEVVTATSLVRTPGEILAHVRAALTRRGYRNLPG